MRRTIAIFASTTLAVLLTYGVAIAAPADLDPGFDEDGRVFTAFAPPGEPRDEAARYVVVQPDGKILAAGYAQTGDYTEMALARYNPDGSLDASFGVGGKVTTDVVADASEEGTALALAPDGKIVVGIYARPNGGNSYGGLVRYNPDGSLDVTFDGDGKVLETHTSSEVSNVAVQSNGKIAVSSYDADGNFALTRYDVDGSLDATFGESGRVTTEVGKPAAGLTGARTLIIQPDGKILMAGAGYGSESLDFGLVRYDPDGSLDSSFSEDGKVLDRLSPSYDIVYDVALQENGKVVAVGTSYWTGVLTRYNSDGSRDTAFGEGGIVARGSISGLRSVFIHPDGNIVAQTNGARLARYKPDGSMDPSLQYDINEDVYDTSGLALQADGKIVQAGKRKSADGSTDFALLRRLGGTGDTAPPETTITSKPKSATQEVEGSFRSSSSEPGSRFECSVGGAAFGPCDPDVHYYSLSQGPHTFRVRATDASGNTDPSPVQYTWTVDSIRPSGEILINGGREATAARKVTLKLGATDPSPGSGVVSMRFKDYGSRSWTFWKPYATSKSWTLTAGTGKKTVYAQYRDRAGNVSAIVKDSIAYRS